MEKHKPKEKWLKSKDIRQKQDWQKKRYNKDFTTEEIWKWIKENPND